MGRENQEGGVEEDGGMEKKISVRPVKGGSSRNVRVAPLEMSRMLKCIKIHRVMTVVNGSTPLEKKRTTPSPYPRRNSLARLKKIRRENSRRESRDGRVKLTLGSAFNSDDVNESVYFFFYRFI